MDCVFCNQQNPPSALFCKKCGRRLDGMSLCVHCGKLTPADGEYCIYCGSNRNAPVYELPRVTVTPEGSRANDDDNVRRAAGVQVHYAEPVTFAKPGAAAVQKPSVAEGRAVTESRAEKSFFSRINTAALSFAGDACAVLAALAAMIFVFLIGTVTTVDTNGVSVSDGMVTGIFHYFGDAYDAIAALSGGPKYTEYGLTVGTALTTICAALALAGTALMFVLTAVRYIKRLTRRTDKPVTGYAVGTYVVYLCGVALFMACVSSSVGVSLVTTYVSLSGASIAGIIIGAIALAACITLKTLAAAKDAGARTLVFNGACCGACAAFAFTVIGLAGSAVAELVSSGGLVDGTTGYGVLGIFGALTTEEIFDSVYFGELTVNILLITSTAALAVCAALSIPRLLDIAGGIMGKRTLAAVYAVGCLGIIAGILRLVASAVLAGGLTTEYVSYSTGNVAAVLLIVFSALIAVGATVYKMLAHKFLERPV